MEDSTEIIVEKENKTPLFNWQKMFWVTGSVVVVLCFICWIAVSSSISNKAEAEKYRQLYKSETLANLNYEIRLDSTMKAIKQLSSYQPLTSAMISRDKVRASMKYQPGDFAVMKVDSSKVLVIDIIAGGDKFNYSLKYKIQRKDKSTEDVSPQLLY